MRSILAFPFQSSAVFFVLLLSVLGRSHARQCFELSEKTGDICISDRLYTIADRLTGTAQQTLEFFQAKPRNVFGKAESGCFLEYIGCARGRNIECACQLVKAVHEIGYDNNFSLEVKQALHHLPPELCGDMLRFMYSLGHELMGLGTANKEAAS